MLCGEASNSALGALRRELPGAPRPPTVAGPVLALRGCRAGPGQPGAKPQQIQEKDVEHIKEIRLIYCQIVFSRDVRY